MAPKSWAEIKVSERKGVTAEAQIVERQPEGGVCQLTRRSKSQVEYTDKNTTSSRATASVSTRRRLSRWRGWRAEQQNERGPRRRSHLLRREIAVAV